MRRLQLLASVAVISASLASYACGGSDEGATTAEDPIAAPSSETDKSPTDPPPASSTPGNNDPPPASSSGGTSSGGTSGNTSTSGGTSSSSGGTSSSSSSGGASSSGGPQTGGSKCLPASISEKEGNDTADAANVLANATGSACGKLSSATDVDYYTFTMPAEMNYLGFGTEYTQQGVEIDVTVGEVTFKVGDKPEVRPGAKYVAKVYSTTGKVPADYRFDVQILKK